VLSLAGAAAAASSSPGDALYGVRSAVATAVQDVVDAITPARPVGPAPQVMAATPTATITPRGQDVSALARSLSAIRQIEDRLTLAESHLDEGRFRPAIQLLDQAESRFEQVLDLTVRAGLANRVEELRDRAAAMSAAAPTHKPTPSATEKAKPKPEAKRATPRPSRSAAAQRGSEAKPAAGGENVRGGESPRTIPSLPSRAQDARDRTGPSLRER
jgi:hypothetical protein